MVSRGEVCGRKSETGEGDEEVTYLHEHWVIYGTAESLYYTPKTNTTLYVYYTRIGKERKEEKKRKKKRKEKKIVGYLERIELSFQQAKP